LRIPQPQETYAINPSSGTQWEYVGSYLSACDSEKYPFDRDVVRAIRADHDPGFVPLLRRTVFRSPGGSDYVWQHHVWARVIEVAEAKLGARQAKKVLWPCNPGATNYGFDRYADRLYIQADLGFLGDSVRSPGKCIPMHWGLYKLVGNLMGIARQQSQAEQARRYDELERAKEEKGKDAALDLVEHTLIENHRRLRGDILVSVPRTFGEAA
jgi:hypothetical protein